MARVSFADARIWQIFSLGLLLTYGVSVLGFDQTTANIAVIIAAALATQWLCSRKIPGQPFDPLSPLITGFSLCLLLRASSPVVLASSAVLAIGSKFVLRFDGKHIFNPANFAISVLLLTDLGEPSAMRKPDAERALADRLASRWSDAPPPSEVRCERTGVSPPPDQSKGGSLLSRSG
jgi:hypothetical protein